MPLADDITAPPPVLLDDEKTWPDKLLRAFDAMLPTLRHYEEVRAAYDKRSEADISFRVRRPSNPHKEAKDQIVAAANAAMADRDVVGFHCTRLHDDDATAIRANGLCLLTPMLMHQRLDQREAAGDIPPVIATSLRAGITKSLRGAPDACREGMTWFVYTRPVLKDESLVGRLLRFWGGEALYGLHEDDPTIAPLLQKIGRASIVLARVSAPDASRHGDIGECMRRLFLEGRGVPLDNRGDLQGAVRNAIGPERIQDIYQFGSKQFETLTSSRRWANKLR